MPKSEVTWWILVWSIFVYHAPYLGHVFLAVMVVAGASLLLPGPGSELAYQTLQIGGYIYLALALFTWWALATFSYLMCCVMEATIIGHLWRKGFMANLADYMGGVMWPIAWLYLDRSLWNDLKVRWSEAVLQSLDYWFIRPFLGYRVPIRNPVTDKIEPVRVKGRRAACRVFLESVNKELGNVDDEEGIQDRLSAN